MKVIYTPSEVAEECFLSEALCWVAFQEYPVEAITENSVSHRRDDEYQEDYEAHRPTQTLLDFMDEDTCKRFGLPTSLDEQEIQSDKSTNLELIDKLLREDYIEAEQKAKLREERVYAVSYNKVRAEYDDALENFLEAPRHKLYLAIKEGKIKCYGRKVAVLKNRDKGANTDLNDNDNWKFFDDEDAHKVYPDFEPIKKDFWRFDSVNWDDSIAKSLSGYYIHILLDFNDVLKEFPERLGTVRQVYVVNDYLIPSDEETSDTKMVNVRGKGRPSYNWDEFHLEVARRFINNEAPDKQVSFISGMQSWCKERWGKEVGWSTILQKVSPYYLELKSQKIVKK